MPLDFAPLPPPGPHARRISRAAPPVAAAVRYCHPYRPRPVRAFAVAVDGCGAIF